MGLFVAVDVGGTTSTVAVGDSDRNVRLVSEQFPTRSQEGPDATIADITTELVRLIDELDGTLADVRQVVLATPGPATLDGVLQGTPNLDPKLWNECPIRSLLQSALHQRHATTTVSYLGDGQAAALGEYAVRRGQVRLDDVSPSHPEANLESLFMVAVGTGMGGGEVRDGRVVRGRKGRAGHAGHLMLPSDAFRYPHDAQLKVGNSLSTSESAVSLTSLTHQLAHRLQLPQWVDHPLRLAGGSDKDKAKQLR
ncbi:MAG: ROK family protein, partial [Planctomycetota bacterium]